MDKKLEAVHKTIEDVPRKVQAVRGPSAQFDYKPLGTVTMYLIDGKKLLLQVDEDGGFEVFAPITDSNSIDEALEAIRTSTRGVIGDL